MKGKTIMQSYQFEKIYLQMEREFGKLEKAKKGHMLCCYCLWRGMR